LRIDAFLISDDTLTDLFPGKNCGAGFNGASAVCPDSFELLERQHFSCFSANGRHFLKGMKAWQHKTYRYQQNEFKVRTAVLCRQINSQTLRRS
uniref:Lactoferrin n=1 Tax=Gongylonema pulchrum TaxID=637853 RepID=A0A183DH40_9BILA